LRIVNAQRGVSWMYVVADPDKSCIIEAGHKTDSLDYLSYVPEDIKNSGFIPSQDFINNHHSTPFRKGVMVRWNNYQYPMEYQNFNPPLMNFMKTYTKMPLALLLTKYKYNYNPLDFAEKGYLNKMWTNNNCPVNYYFPPQRENRDDFLLASNHFLIPEMRLCAMLEWTQFVASGNIQDIQWRYDELNNELLNALEHPPVTYATLKNIMLFCSPYSAKFPDYYNPQGLPKEKVYVHGAISLIDLKSNVIESLYGYFKDEWVTIHLNEYFK